VVADVRIPLDRPRTVATRTVPAFEEVAAEIRRILQMDAANQPPPDLVPGEPH
jgi:hypothetical protein